MIFFQLWQYDSLFCNPSSNFEYLVLCNKLARKRKKIENSEQTTWQREPPKAPASGPPLQLLQGPPTTDGPSLSFLPLGPGEEARKAFLRPPGEFHGAKGCSRQPRLEVKAGDTDISQGALCAIGT